MISPLIFACLVTSAFDGDTLRCADGTRVRLQAIDAPEMRKCRKGRTCAPGDPVAAKAALSRLALGKTLRCRKTGTSYSRITAWCRVDGIDLSCAMFSAGHAVRVARYDTPRRLCR
jgi:endonuclease YncB( thermonuclease family)